MLSLFPELFFVKHKYTKTILNPQVAMVTYHYCIGALIQTRSTLFCWSCFYCINVNNLSSHILVFHCTYSFQVATSEAEK